MIQDTFVAVGAEDGWLNDPYGTDNAAVVEFVTEAIVYTVPLIEIFRPTSAAEKLAVADVTVADPFVTDRSVPLRDKA